jgi:hypothetical protein
MLPLLHATWLRANKTVRNNPLLFLVWFVLWNLFTDRVFGWANDEITRNASGMTAKIAALILWFNTPFTLLATIAIGTLSAIVIHAYVKSLGSTAELPKEPALSGLVIHAAWYGAQGQFRDAVKLKRSGLGNTLDLLVQSQDLVESDPIVGIAKYLVVAYTSPNDNRLKFAFAMEGERLLIPADHLPRKVQTEILNDLSSSVRLVDDLKAAKEGIIRKDREINELQRTIQLQTISDGQKQKRIGELIQIEDRQKLEIEALKADILSLESDKRDLRIALNHFKDELAHQILFWQPLEKGDELERLFRHILVTVRYFEIEDSELADKIQKPFTVTMVKGSWECKIERKTDHVSKKPKNARIFVNANNHFLAKTIMDTFNSSTWIDERIEMDASDPRPDGALILVYPIKAESNR